MTPGRCLLEDLLLDLIRTHSIQMRVPLRINSRFRRAPIVHRHVIKLIFPKLIIFRRNFLQNFLLGVHTDLIQIGLMLLVHVFVIGGGEFAVLGEVLRILKKLLRQSFVNIFEINWIQDLAIVQAL